MHKNFCKYCEEVLCIIMSQSTCEAMFVYVGTYIGVTSRLWITSSMMWHDMDPIWFVEQAPKLFMAVIISIISRHGLTVEACHRNQPNTVQPMNELTSSYMPTHKTFYWQTQVAALQVCHYYVFHVHWLCHAHLRIYKKTVNTGTGQLIWSLWGHLRAVL